MKHSTSSIKVQRLLAALVLLTSLLSLGIGSAWAQTALPDAAPQNTLNGSVLLDGGGAPAGAFVLAWKGGHSASAAVQLDGSYSLMLGTGDWQVTVNAGVVSTTSPDWVYTGDPQAVSFTANPDPTHPTQSLNFSVTPAPGVISGSILAPDGSTNFADPNQVWVRAENQEGDGNTVLADPLTGLFRINVLPGNTLVKLALQNTQWAPPVTLSGSQWLTSSTAPVSTGSLQLIARQAQITGSVVDQDGHSVAGLPVRAWRVDGAETARVLTDSSGNYTLWLVQGLWEVQVNPPPASLYVPAQEPQTVALPLANSTAVQALAVALADVTVNGTLVDAHGTPVTGLDGHVFALYRDGVRWPQFGQSAAITSSSFTLKLSTHVATDYKLKGSFPALMGYSMIDDVVLHNVQAGQTYTVTMPVAVDNSTISGHLLDHANDQPKTDLPGAIYGASDSGALKMAKVNPVTGGYQINAASTDTSGHGGTFWFLHGFVDPTTTFTVMKPRNQKVFLPYNNGSGANVTADFTVAAINAAIGGQVLDPQSTPVAGAKVNIVEDGVASGLAFRRWALTGPNGHFLVAVPAGTYKITVDYKNWVAPLPQVVPVASLQVKTVTLSFRTRDALVSGLVAYNGSPHTAFIRAYSDTGAHVIGLAGADGKYVISVNSGDVWHIQAVSEEGSTFLKSDRLSVTPAPGGNKNNDLVLKASDTLPETVLFTFDASQDQQFILSNGAQVIIPAGAMAPSGLVTLVVRPLAELADNGGAQPVSFGYRLNAFDENHLPIDHFNTPVTLGMPFTAAQLAALGVGPDSLVPSYWDVATTSWKPVPNYSLETAADGSGMLSLSINHFTDYGILSDIRPFRAYLPVTIH